MQTTIYPDWKDKVVYSDEGPQPHVLMADEKVKFILAGLKSGQQIPDHTEAQAIYHFLDGNGWMTVDGERTAVNPGATIVMPQGASRGMEAETQLAFLAIRIS